MIEMLETRVLLSGQTIVVNTNADVDSAGTTTLRDAVNEANAQSGDTITFASSLAGETITLTQGALGVSGSMAITGLGASQLAISGGSVSQVFEIFGETAHSITGLTIENGAVTGSGGAIVNNGDLTLTDDIISHNGAVAATGSLNGPVPVSYGGAIYNENNSTLTSSGNTIIDNTVVNGDGGGIFNSGLLTSTNDTISNNTAGLGGGIANQISNSGFNTVTLTNDTISNNTAGLGGGIANFGGAVTSINTTIADNHATAGLSGGRGGGVYNERVQGVTPAPAAAFFYSSGDTISGNSATGDGGGVFNDDAVFESTNDTIADNMTLNTRTGYGGGIAGFAGGNVITVNDTITNNSAKSGGGVAIDGSGNLAWNSWNTIIAGNPSGNDVFVTSTNTMINMFNSLVGDSSLSAAQIANGSGNIFDPANSGIFVTDSSGHPLLANNGGPTQTIALAPGSPAIGVGGSLTTLSADVTSTATTFAVTSSTPLAVGDLLQVGSEVVEVASISGSTVTVLRGQDGSTAAAYSSGQSLALAYDQRGVARESNSIGAFSNSNTNIGTNTNIGLASSSPSSGFGQSLTFTATVSPVSPGTGTPTGQVTFDDGSTTLGTGMLSVVNGVDVATFTTSTLASGSHSIIAVYGGDTNFNSSTSTTLTQTINPLPAITGPSSVGVNENVSLALSGSNLISVTDTAGTGNNLESMTLTVQQGTLTFGSTTNLTVTGNGTSEITVSGSLSQLNSGLTSLTYTPNAGYLGADTLSLSNEDTTDGLTGTKSVAIAVNPPAPTITAPATISLNQGSTLTFSGANVISVTDPGGTAEQLKLTVSHGTLKLGTTIGLTVTGSGTATLTLTGTLASLNSDLASLVYTPTAGYHGAGTLSLSNQDTTDSLTGTTSVALTVNPLAPTITAPARASLNKGSTLKFSGANAISVTDPSGTAEQLTLTVSHGTLKLGTTTGLTVTGNGTATLTLTGTLASLNSDLASLVYIPTAGYHGADALSLSDTDTTDSLTGTKSVALTV
jgi:hypothetical protein